MDDLKDDFEKLFNNQHLREAVARVVPVMQLVQGTAKSPSLDDLLRRVAMCIEALRQYPDTKTTANSGGMRVTRVRYGDQEYENYEICVVASTVYGLHMMMDERRRQSGPESPESRWTIPPDHRPTCPLDSQPCPNWTCVFDVCVDDKKPREAL